MRTICGASARRLSAVALTGAVGLAMLTLTSGKAWAQG
jgi:hypothetical protein